MRQSALVVAAASALAVAGSDIFAMPSHGPGVRRARIGTSKYMPHQSDREIARRLRQAGSVAA